MSIGRFKEYSGSEADSISAAHAATLASLEKVPSLLMYEVGAIGPNARLVRHGTLRNIRVLAGELHFTFEADAQRPFLTLADIQRYASDLDLHKFELHRTHWAVKDGDLPADLLALATLEPPIRTLATVEGEYFDARAKGDRVQMATLLNEIEACPKSLEKAVFLLRRSKVQRLPPSAVPHLVPEKKMTERRELVREILGNDDRRKELLRSDPLTVVQLLEYYNCPTEAGALKGAIDQAEHHVRTLLANRASTASIADSLWRFARSPTLARRARATVALLLEDLCRRRDSGGAWTDESGRPDIRTTALATVALLRLGSDRHRSATHELVLWICENRTKCGAFPRIKNGPEDVPATVFALEAIRRSNLKDQMTHILEEGDEWLRAQQDAAGSWTADELDELVLTAAVLDYFSELNSMLPQVDGFFLMAREFYRRAEALADEDSTNSRRLAAIACVHAMEMFLYGLFERREDLGLSAYRENGVETLGPREALGALQERLWSAGLLTPPRRLKNRDALSSLVGRRDGIIHRAHEISSDELAAGLRAVRRFIEEYGAQLVGLDLLQ